MSIVSDRPREFSLEDRYRVEDAEIYLTGTQALVRVLLDQRRADLRAGLNTAGFASGYPGSPLGGVDLELQRQRVLLEEFHVVHTPGLNEDLAATAVFGTQLVNELPGANYDGVFGMWWGKAPGVDRAGDAIRHGNFRGTSPTGGVITVAGDDPDAKSSILPSDSTRAFADWGMPVLFPGDTQAVLDLGAHGYALSRMSGLGVGLKMVSDIADGAGTAQVAPDRIVPIRVGEGPGGALFIPQVRMNVAGPPMRDAERELFTTRLAMARNYITANKLNRIVLGRSDARIGLVAPGKTFFDLRNALRLLGLDDAALEHAGIRLLRFDALYPLDPAALREYAAGLDELIVVEEKRELIESAFKEALYSAAQHPMILGKNDDQGAAFLPNSGELSAEIIARALGGRLQNRWDMAQLATPLADLSRPKRALLPLSVSRTPYFCSGCPHNRSLIAPEGAIVGAGIGCHIMALTQPRDEYGEIAGFTQMGGEGSQWLGVAPFTSTPHMFQNLGDGTFHHSGSLAIRFAVAAKVNMTYKLLYNSAVGMTGGQDVQGVIAIPALTRWLAAEGVRKVIVTTDDMKRYKGVSLDRIAKVMHRDRLVEAQESLAAVPGVTVLIHDQQCAAEKRRLRKRDRLPTPTVRVHIDERVCEGCGDCGRKSNCLSVQPIETKFGRKTQIDQTSCNLDFSCLRGDCPSFVSVDVKHAKAPTLPSPPEDSVLATPSPAPLDGGAYTIHMAGIGGTGVVTVSQILATAASLDGRHVRDLDLTGSSQKAGPVVSQLQVFAEPIDSATTISEGQAGTLLLFDVLAAMTDVTLSKASPERTIAISSTAKVSTGRMSVRADTPFPDLGAMLAEVDRRTKAERNVSFDAAGLARTVLGNEMSANLVLLGAAIQAGALPITLNSLRQAIKTNGVAIEQNLAAIQWGRAMVAAPDVVPAVLPRRRNARQTEVPAELQQLMHRVGGSGQVMELLAVRVPELIDYQDADYARRYLNLLIDVAEAERRVSADDELLRTVAAQYYTLLAYKDEYEVARLHLLPEAQEAIEAQFGEGVKVSWNLHPPILRAMGMDHKIRLGPWFRPAFSTLARMKGLRGTRADFFGYAEVRKVERALIDQYDAVLRAALTKLDAGSLPGLTALAGLPDAVRGYEGVKLGNVADYEQRLAGMAGALGITVPVGAALRNHAPR